MKKWMRILALTLALSMLMGLSIFAAGTIERVEFKTENVGITGGASPSGQAQFSMTYNGEAVNAMYLLLVLDDEALEDNEELPTASSIKYVNQATADANGDVTFATVYPTDITASTIYLAGGDFIKMEAVGSITPVAADEPEYILGDVNEDKNIDMTDISLLLQYINGEPVLSGDQITAADVTGDSNQDMSDVSYILQFINGDLTKFPVEE